MKTNLDFVRKPDPQTTEWAEAELRRALDALAKADDALARNDNPAEVEHWVYIARQRAASALEMVRQKSAKKLAD